MKSVVWVCYRFSSNRKRIVKRNMVYLLKRRVLKFPSKTWPCLGRGTKESNMLNFYKVWSWSMDRRSDCAKKQFIGSLIFLLERQVHTRNTWSHNLCPYALNPLSQGNLHLFNKSLVWKRVYFKLDWMPADKIHNTTIPHNINS